MAKVKKPKGFKPRAGKPSPVQTTLLILELIKEIIELVQKYGPDVIEVLRDFIDKLRRKLRKKRPEKTARPLKQLEETTAELKRKSVKSKTGSKPKKGRTKN